MSLTEEEIRRAAELRQWVESRLLELQGEVERLRDFQVFLDGILRRSSFKPAVEVGEQATTGKRKEVLPEVGERVEFKETRPLKRASDSLLLANAYISQTQMAIVPSSDARLNVETPPFKSFFINRILEGMKGKDMEALAQGRIAFDQAFSYEIEEEVGLIKRILVKNYHDKGRLTEILNTATWVFSRMLEKKP